jgi:hypothetical protein
MKYVGQTKQQFRVFFKEHFRDYRHANNRSKLAQHLLENGHSFGHIDDIMEVLYTTKKGNTLENFYTFKETHDNNQINDRNTVKPNPIFDIVVREETGIVHTPK